MPQFRFQIQGDKYPSDYTVVATNWATASARAVREWRKSAGKGSRTSQLTIKGLKLNELKP